MSSNGRIIRALQVTSILIGAVWVVSCAAPAEKTRQWATYTNKRYGFQFPYPQEWVALRTPENRDGQIFQHPDHPDLQIRGWAGHLLEPLKIPTQTSTSLQNFRTTQGLTGQLQIDIGTEISRMQLRLIQGQRIYIWQGQAPSPEFPHYYPLFDAIAREYRILPSQSSLK